MQSKYKRVSYWFPLVKSLTKWLNEYTIDEVDEDGKPIRLFADVEDIYSGTKDKGRDFPCIEVLWESEVEISNNLPTTGVVTLYIDVCVDCNEDEPDKAYEAIDDLQCRILSILREWAPAARNETGVAPNVTIEGIVSDGDIYRPAATSRIVLTIEWRKVNG